MAYTVFMDGFRMNSAAGQWLANFWQTPSYKEEKITKGHQRVIYIKNHIRERRKGRRVATRAAIAIKTVALQIKLSFIIFKVTWYQWHSYQWARWYRAPRLSSSGGLSDSDPQASRTCDNFSRNKL
ncbi:hypothetical protein TNCV_24801 [Trichonephila clavipes]|uniref:Uncharacterized protein n=1 Tax=Trichonephila clavipes TaxID=2585209 RepID=A0A8X7BDC1_TRICX|nr:hypothetical protein TNCV_24801 [Trichonephila clavipes]